MSTIDAQKQDENAEQFVFHVRVQDGRSDSKHVVTLEKNTFAELCTQSCSPTEFIEASFRFLLERESKEAILASFAIRDISKYFPEFEEVIRERVTSE